jgi:hypothetical protein
MRNQVHFWVLMANSGREPARDVNIRIKGTTIDAFNVITTSLENITIPGDTSFCEGVHPANSRLIIPPLTGTGNATDLDSVYEEPPFYVDDKILRGEKYYVVRGCIVYVTYSVPRRTTFCYILISGPIPTAAFFPQLGQNQPATGTPPQLGQNQPATGPPLSWVRTSPRPALPSAGSAPAREPTRHGQSSDICLLPNRI